MKKRYTEEQIVKILREAGTSGKVADVCRKHGISEPTYYNWKKKYDGMEASDLRKLKTLEDENRRLKRLLADKELDIDALKALLEKYGSAR
jgi:putative transposase